MATLDFSGTDTKEDAPWPVVTSSLTKIMGKDSGRIYPSEDADTLVISNNWVIVSEFDAMKTTQQHYSKHLHAEQYYGKHDAFQLSSRNESENVQQKTIEDKNAARIELLARKYASSKLPLEITARLEMLTEEMRNLLPSISDKDIEKMKELSEQANEFSSFNIEMRQKYGLDID